MGLTPNTSVLMDNSTRFWCLSIKHDRVTVFSHNEVSSNNLIAAVSLRFRLLARICKRRG